MVPVVSTPVSLFGAPLGVASTSDPVIGFGGGLSAGKLIAGMTPVPLTVPTGALGAAPAPFADLLTEAVGQVEQLERQATVSIEGLISGKGVDVHEAMIAAQKAGMGFELVLSVRNKALAAYQQVMGMQF
jgi:flagellar hook-basal body complex protein FliE